MGEDKDRSFTDSTSNVWLKKHRVQHVVSMDKDFSQFGFVENLVGRL
jgi:predicted nucleic acid-binding protein